MEAEIIFGVLVVGAIWYLMISPVYSFYLKRPVGMMHVDQCAELALIWPISLPIVFIIMFFKAPFK